MVETNIIDKNYVLVDSKETISSFIGKIKVANRKVAVVFDGKTYLGITSNNNIVNARAKADVAKVANIVRNVPPLEGNESIVDIAEKMYNANCSMLPVFVKNALIGTVNASSVIQVIKTLPELGELLVSNCMVKKVISCNLNERIDRAMAIMIKNNIHHIPVMENEFLVGVLSMNDILTKVISKTQHREVSMNLSNTRQSGSSDSHNFLSLSVENFCTKNNVVVATSADKVKTVVDKMVKYGVSDVIILSDQTVVGIITIRDLLGLIVSTKHTENYNIFFTGLSNPALTVEHQNKIRKLCGNYSAKIERILNNDIAIGVNLKTYKDVGKKDKAHKYTFNIKVKYGSDNFATEQTDWDVEKALHKSFKNLLHMIEHRFNASSKRIF